MKIIDFRVKIGDSRLYCKFFEKDRNMENTFDIFNLDPDIKKALDLLNYKEPTKVQQLVIPEALTKKDLIVKSQTGSGKTASYGIPLCEFVDWEENRPQALVLAPTRELALQIKEDIFHIGRFKRLKVPALYGKASITFQMNELKLKSHIVVGTPGRVFDHIERGTLNTEKLSYLVIDEADEMLKMGFIEQVADILEKLPDNIITMLFSATVSPEIQKLAGKYMKNPVFIEVEAETLTVEKIEQVAYKTKEREKSSLLKDVLTVENPDACIIFCNTQEDVNDVCDGLNHDRFPCKKIHGGMEQKERIRIMEQMKRGSFRYLVATDVAARGIDIENITHVINYNLPKAKENYVHRIGRTARNGKEGKAISFIGERETGYWAMIEDYTGNTIKILTNPDQETVEENREAFLAKIHSRPQLKKEKSHQLDKGITKIHINAGKKTKMRPGDVVGAICGIEGMTAEDIGVIEIQDISTFVEILNQKGDMVVRQLQDKNIKGRLRKVSKKDRY